MIDGQIEETRLPREVTPGRNRVGVALLCVAAFTALLVLALGPHGVTSKTGYICDEDPGHYYRTNALGQPIEAAFCDPRSGDYRTFKGGRRVR